MKGLPTNTKVKEREEMDGDGDGKLDKAKPPASLFKEIVNNYGMSILRVGILPAFIFASMYLTGSQFALLMNVVFWTVLVVLFASMLVLVMWVLKD